LGHKQGVKGAVLFDLNTKTIFVSRNVTFHEQILPYQNTTSHSHWQYHSDQDTVSADISAEHVNYDDDLTPVTHNHNLPSNTNTNDPIDISIPPISHTNIPDNHSTTPATPPTTNDPFVPRRSTRSTHLPSHLSDYICNLSAVSNQSSSSGILYPISQYHSCANSSIKKYINYQQHQRQHLIINNDNINSINKQQQ
jgi:hypothetical protein